MCIPGTGCCIFVLLRAPSLVVACNIAKVQNIRCIASSQKFFLVWEYGMEYGRKFWYGMEDFKYEMEMEWKKIASVEYGKIIFHSIPHHALP